jgi:hypothetical protein
VIKFSFPSLAIVSLIVMMGHLPQRATARETEPQVQDEGLPRWNPQDPRKGFLRVDEEDGYYYEEDKASSERFYDDDVKVVAKPENYERGLLNVTSDGSYVYAGDESSLDGSASIRAGQMPPIPLQNTSGFFYEDIYGSSNLPLVLVDYDWLALRKYGQWIINVGAGLGSTSGQGRFVDTGEEAREQYTLYVLLPHVSFIYRMQYSSHPWMVPYFSGGGVPAVLVERRDDSKKSKYEFVPAAQASGGVRLNLGKLDAASVANLDAEYGINNLWLDVEFRRIQSFNDKIDISSNLLNLGLGFDF